VTQCKCDDPPRRILRIPAGLSALPRQAQEFPGLVMRRPPVMPSALFRVGAAAANNPGARGEVNHRVTRSLLLERGAARPLFTQAQLCKIPSEPSHVPAAILDADLANAGAVGVARLDTIIAAEATLGIGIALAVLALAETGSTALPAVHRIGRRLATTARRARGRARAAASARTRRPATALRCAASSALCGPRRSGDVTHPSTTCCGGTTCAAGASRAPVCGSFDTKVAAAFEAAIAATAPTGATLRTCSARRVVLPRLRAARADEQRDRKPQQPPKTSQHVVLVRPKGSHARQPQARFGLGAPTKEALL
jgi:hypothetical protein